MTVSVTFSSQVGGDDSTYSDGTGVGGMAEGGHLLYFFPMLQQYLNVAYFVTVAAGQASDAATAASASSVGSTTSTSITVGTGSKTFNLNSTGKPFFKGQRVVVASSANALNSVAGTITAFTDPAMTINADTVSGSGTFTDGIVSLTGSGGVPASRTVATSGLATGGGDLSANRTITVTAATATDVRVGTSTSAAMTVGGTYGALAEVTLQYGATITTTGDISLDMSKFLNAVVTMGGNGALPNPVNHKPGQSGRIRIIQDSTGNRGLSSWGTFYKADAGRPVLSTAPGTIDYLYYDVVSPTEIMCSFVKAPSN